VEFLCRCTEKIQSLYLHPQFDYFAITVESTLLLAEALDRPFLLAQGTPVVLLDPQGHAAVVERVVALAPNHHAVLLARLLFLVFRLTPQARIWNTREFSLSNASVGWVVF
jgi:hypothetical protein